MDPEEREVIKKTRDKNKDMAKSEKAKAGANKPRVTHGMLPDVAKKIDEERAKKAKTNSKDYAMVAPTSKEKGEPKAKPKNAIASAPKAPPVPKSKPAAPVKTGGADTTAKGKAMKDKMLASATKKSAPKTDSVMEDKKSNRKYESKIPTVFGIPLKVTKDKEQSRNPAEERMFGRER